MKSKIKISYPQTEYYLLNENLIEQLNVVIKEFVEYEKVLAKQGIHYTLEVIDEPHAYQDYISYVFYVSIYAGGAHPNSVVLTVNYDSRENKMITVNEIIKNDTILNNICTESRKQLQSNEIIGSDPTSMKLMIEGTAPVKNNYKNFSFEKEGIIFYFQQSQIAPYSSGIMKTVIPYHLFEQ